MTGRYREHCVYKTTWSPAIGQVLQVGAEDSNAYGTCACACEIIGSVTFPAARGHFNYANLFFAKCFSLANSQKFDSRINNRLYGIHGRPQTNCNVFKWVPSITALTIDRWLANRQLITHTASCLRFCTTAALVQLTGFILNLGTQINFCPERVRH